MKERPILFSGPMVRAILAGTKTQTRRIVKNQGSLLYQPVYELEDVNDPDNWLWPYRQGWYESLGRDSYDGINVRPRPCPYGQAGDRLWVKETYALVPLSEDDGGQGDKMGYIYRADGETAFANMPDEWEFTGPWKPSIFMRREYSRLTLEIESIRVERLQDISEEDAIAEGIKLVRHDGNGLDTSYEWIPSEDGQDTAVTAFGCLWESINGPGSWDANPWVWAVEFRRIEKGGEA